MKTSLWVHGFFLGLIFLSSSCTAPRREVFHEDDFAWTLRAGTGAVDGQAFIEMKDRTINLGSNSQVILLPVNAYTTETMNRKYEHGVNLVAPDPRMARYTHLADTDGQGRFSFRGLAPGEYYVGSMVDWQNKYWAPDNDNVLQKYSDHHSQFIRKRITVRNGETVHITDWRQAADWNMDTVLH